MLKADWVAVEASAPSGPVSVEALGQANRLFSDAALDDILNSKLIRSSADHRLPIERKAEA